MKRRFLCLFLSISLVLSVTTISFAGVAGKKNDILMDRIEYYSGDIEIDPMKSNTYSPYREQPPEYWKLASSNSYNELIRNVTVSAVFGVVWGWLGGGVLTTAECKGMVKKIVASLGTGVAFSANVNANKTVYYKINTDGNGYPYYCQEISSTWFDEDKANKQIKVKYFYSYQPY